MKLYISADIEGVACAAAASDFTTAGSAADYTPFQRQMTAEVMAACRGGYAGGAQEIVVKDAHHTGRNLDIHALAAPHDKQLRLIRGWSGHPFAMVQDIDRSFSAVAFIGFHSAAGSGAVPLAHTVSGARFASVELNGEPASECLLYGYAAASMGVPLVFVSGDAALCAQAQDQFDALVTVPTLVGGGASTTSILPGEATRRIEAGLQQALSRPLPPAVPVPGDLHFKLGFHRATDAYERSFFPGARAVSDKELLFETNDYFALLTFLWFVSE